MLSHSLQEIGKMMEDEEKLPFIMYSPSACFLITMHSIFIIFLFSSIDGCLDGIREGK